jgi:hypothetical protein
MRAQVPSDHSPMRVRRWGLPSPDSVTPGNDLIVDR